MQGNILRIAVSLVEDIFLPELKDDLDTSPINPERFSNYRGRLEVQLPILYHLIQDHEEVLLGGQDTNNAEFKCLLVALLCETTSVVSIFHYSKQQFINNGNSLLEKLLNSERNWISLIFDYYQDKLRNEKCKRQLGAIYGFLRFLDFYFGVPSKRAMTAEWITFSLSVGLNVREGVDPIYKDLGVRIFLQILGQQKFVLIKNMNIHCVIYENVLNDVYRMDTVESTSLVWKCLILCLENDDIIDNVTWNHCDDLLEQLIKNTSLTSNVDVFMCLLQIITKLGYQYSINCQVIETKLDSDLYNSEFENEVNFFRTSNSSYTCYRWAKSILEMLVLKSDQLLQNVDTSRKILIEMHRCYLSCIISIPLYVLQMHLDEFFNKFTAVLLKLIVLYNKDPLIVKIVEKFIQTFYLQLYQSPYCEFNRQLKEYQLAFKQLLKSNVFNNIK